MNEAEPSSVKEYILAARCGESLTRLGLKAKIHQHPNGCWILDSTNARFGRAFQRDFGRGAPTKTIPRWVLELPNSLLNVMLNAYLEGDGSKTNYGHVVANAWTVSASLAFSLKLVAERLGHNVNISNTKAKSHILGRKVNAKQGYQLNFLEHSKWSSHERHERCLVQRIRSITKELYAGPVFDLRVEDDESFVTPSGAVHNCPFQKREEWEWLFRNHRDLFIRALDLEESSKHFPRQMLYEGGLRNLMNEFGSTPFR